MKNLFHLLCLFALLQSCLGVAKVSDFETDAAAIDFDLLAQNYQEEDTQQRWTFKTEDEYYFEIPMSTISEELLTETALEVFSKHKYYRLEKDLVKNRILGHRAIRPNEWSTISAVYYQFNMTEKKIQVYVYSKITQDIRGGVTEKYAKKLGVMIGRLTEIKAIRERRK